MAARRTIPLRLATWHAGSGDHAVIRPHYRGRDVAFGSFHCEPGDVRWRLENQVGEVPHIVFPITPWQLAVGHGEPELVTRNHAVFFNADEAFRREAFGAHGDRSHFMTLRPHVAEEILHDVPAAPVARFPRSVGRLSSRPFLAEMLVRRRLAAGADPLDAEERLLTLARQAVRRRVRRRAACARQAAAVRRGRQGAPDHAPRRAPDAARDRRGPERLGLPPRPHVPRAHRLLAARLPARAAAAAGGGPRGRRGHGSARGRGARRLLEPQPPHGGVPQALRRPPVRGPRPGAAFEFVRTFARRWPDSRPGAIGSEPNLTPRG